MLDPTPLTEEAQETLERICDAARETYHEVGEGSGAAAGARRGFKAAHAFYSERERALRTAAFELNAALEEELVRTTSEIHQPVRLSTNPEGWQRVMDARAALEALKSDLAPSTTEGGREHITTAHRVTERDGELVVEPPIQPGRSIYLDSQPFTVQGNEITEAQLRDLPVARVPDDFEIWIEQPQADDIVEQARPVRIEGGERFYTTPRQIRPGATTEGVGGEGVPCIICGSAEELPSGDCAQCERNAAIDRGDDPACLIPRATEGAREGEREETPFEPEQARHIIEAVPASEIRAGDDIMCTDLIRRVHDVKPYVAMIPGTENNGLSFDLKDRWKRYEDAEPVYRVRAPEQLLDEAREDAVAKAIWMERNGVVEPSDGEWTELFPSVRDDYHRQARAALAAASPNPMGGER